MGHNSYFRVLSLNNLKRSNVGDKAIMSNALKRASFRINNAELTSIRRLTSPSKSGCGGSKP